MSDNVKVAVRVRPFNGREKDRKATCCIAMEGPITRITNPDGGQVKSFTFDYSYNSFVERDDPAYASQDAVWADLGVGILHNAWEGYNCSLFAYGQTGSGKSYSMMGYGEDKGIIPLACERIFHRRDANTDDSLTIKVEASMLEIYMEKIRDLFNPKAGDNLKIRNDPKRGFYVDGLTKNTCGNFLQIEKLMEAGAKARTVASTNMNATSSRAHTIFQLILTQTKVDAAAGKATDKTSLLNLIDLAGSERAGSTGATGDRLKEGSAINLSLSSLGNCISALAKNSTGSKKTRVPYRDSVLTMLLQNSLGGNAKTIMIAAISPADINFDETLGTLRYADRAKQIKNKAVVNEDPNQKLIRNLKAEIEALKAQLQGSIAETDQRVLANEADLGKMGVAFGEQRKQQSERAAKDPHMANLHDDPMLSNQVMYFFEEGASLTVGRKDAEQEQDVKLGGLAIEREHCVILREGNTITLAPIGSAKVHINGELVTAPTELHHNNRVVFGNYHVYKVGIPAEVEAGTAPAESDVPEDVDYSFAITEMNKAQVEQMKVHEEQLMREAEEEKRKAAEKMKELEEEMEKERLRVQQEAEERRAALEQRERELAEQQAKMTEEQKAQVEKEREEARAKYEQEQNEMQRKYQMLEEQMAQQKEEMAALAIRKKREAKERSILDDKLMRTIPLVNEANAISEELGKGMTFSIKLMANPDFVSTAGQVAGGDEDVPEQLSTEIFSKIEFADNTPHVMWRYDKFMNRLYLMREMYNTFAENDRSIKGTEYDTSDHDKDPFYDPPEDQLLGKATIYLDSLQHVFSIDESTPIIDYKGSEQGELLVRIVPHKTPEPPATEDDEEDLADSMADLKGSPLNLSVIVKSARGLPAQRNSDVYVKYRFFLEESDVATAPHAGRSMNPSFNHTSTFPLVVTDEFVRYVKTDAIEFCVYCKHDGNQKAAAGAATPVANAAAVDVPKVAEAKAEPTPMAAAAPTSSEEEPAAVVADAADAKAEAEAKAKADAQAAASAAAAAEAEAEAKRKREEAEKEAEERRKREGDTAEAKAAAADAAKREAEAKKQLEAEKEKARQLERELTEIRQQREAAAAKESSTAPTAPSVATEPSAESPKVVVKVGGASAGCFGSSDPSQNKKKCLIL